MRIIEFVVTFLGFFMLIPTIASLTRFDQWWVRGFDFPRIQISLFILIILVSTFFTYEYDATLHFVLSGLLVLSLIYQVSKIFPYTVLSKKQVLSFKGNDPEAIISILVSNVLTTNKQSDKLIALVKKKEPDILLTLETDKRWEKELEVIEPQYPYGVKIPLDNLYGMHLYSKLKLEDIEVKYLIKGDIPSIHGYVRMNNKKRIKIHCLHPKPPSPTEDPTSTNRDAELLLVGRDVKKDQESVLVFGDLNDVAWSRTTRLFQKLSGLLDPRIGRGFYNTFHAGHRLLRWPLDHVFHTRDFTLIELARLENIGSDHFPMFIKLNYEPRAEILQEEPEEADEEEKEWAEEKIEEGHPTEREV
ncbi:endonuclease/exonuclease/phosphatase family protein [Antarcticibacterium sp. 1MA-6-2]|uniref:endonuclease/exonuclease/phosphatase family protein n=1 Tax=Antarcticibacterium sp. 1MA-6-2 TaxID=2908210 RepID=UPI001F209C59|nr:endonuclease/exonuclease/phosphatase family protein [Antarcticibacterium sp. 1MA-6-2]UJH91339.1 endonuclease/exonuclease/phosphatase family protein [Antarcticibacterium sp. 1MA-6-2]